MAKKINHMKTNSLIRESPPTVLMYLPTYLLINTYFQCEIKHYYHYETKIHHDILT